MVRGSRPPYVDRNTLFIGFKCQSLRLRVVVGQDHGSSAPPPAMHLDPYLGIDLDVADDSWTVGRRWPQARSCYLRAVHLPAFGEVARYCAPLSRLPPSQGATPAHGR